MFGAIAGSLISGAMANKAAKSQASAMNAANYANQAGFRDARPYNKFGYAQNKDAYNNALEMGTYQGDRYAGLNPMQDAAYTGMYGFGQNQADMGQGLMNTGAGFGQNYQNLYNQASQDMLGNAMDYAAQNQEPLLAAAMRDPYRQLTENTLTGINQGASATGNANSSRAGVAEAVANRGFNDRMADTATNIQQNLINQSMNAQQNQFGNMMRANQGLYNTLSAGQNMAGAGFGDMAGAGSAFQTDSQNRMNTDMNAFNEQRDFQGNLVNNYMSNMGQAPKSYTGTQAVTTDPYSASLGGAMAGFGFGNKYLQPMIDKFQAQRQYNNYASYPGNN